MSTYIEFLLKIFCLLRRIMTTMVTTRRTTVTPKMPITRPMYICQNTNENIITMPLVCTTFIAKSLYNNATLLLKFRYSEKVTKIWPIFRFKVMSKKEWKMGQIFWAFSKYLNFTGKPQFKKPHFSFL